MKKSTLKKVILLGLVCGNISFGNQALAAGVGFTLANEHDGVYYYGDASATYNYYIYGNSSDGKVANLTNNFSKNTITVYEGNRYNYGFYGTYNSVSSDAVLGNKIVFNGGVLRYLLGGCRNNAGDVGGNFVEDGNSVIITGATPYSYVQHGEKYTESSVYGGRGTSVGNVCYNSVVILGDISNYADSINNIFGGAGGENNYSNFVYVDGGWFGSVIGGSSSGEVHDNSVTIVGGRHTGGAIIGASTSGLGKNVYNNKVHIGSGLDSDIVGGFQVYGGWNSASGDAASNTAVVKGNIVHIESGMYINMPEIIGGKCANGGFAGGATEAEGNKVVLDGGYYENVLIVAGGSAGNGAQYNSVEITSNCHGSFLSVYGGGGSWGAASNNKATVRGGKISSLWGGGGSDATYNTVYVDGGNIKTIIGGSATNVSSNNTVTVKSGQFTDICGGKGDEVSNNIVNISGGTFSGKIVAGWSTTDPTKATNNSIEISGGEFCSDVSLWGSYYDYGMGGNPNGNKLVISNSVVSVGKVINFQNYEFNIGDGIHKGDIVLDVLNCYKYDCVVDLTGAKIDVVIDETVKNYTKGEKIILINGTKEGITLPAANLNIWTDTIGGTSYSGPVKLVLSGKQMLLGNLAGDYIIQNSTGTVVDHESGIDGNYTSVYGNSSDGTEVGKNNNWSNNVVSVNQGYYQTVYGAYDDDSCNDLKNNNVSVKGGFVTAVYGGYANSGNVGGANVEDGNSVIINVSKMLLGCNYIYGGRTQQNTGDVLNNKVEIIGLDDENLDCRICLVYGGISKKGTIDHNTILIEAGLFDYNDPKIYGGYSYDGGNVTNNTVEIGGGTFGSTTKIYGGYTSGTSTGNKLILNNKKLDVDTVDRF